MSGQSVEIGVQLGAFAIAEPTIRREGALLRLDIAELAIQPSRLVVGDPAILEATLDACVDARLAVVDACRTLVTPVILHRNDVCRADVVRAHLNRRIVRRGDPGCDDTCGCNCDQHLSHHASLSSAGVDMRRRSICTNGSKSRGVDDAARMLVTMHYVCVGCDRGERFAAPACRTRSDVVNRLHLQGELPRIWTIGRSVSLHGGARSNA